MKLTKQQEAILATDSNIRVDAVAGSGKTTTLVSYAQSRPKSATILYLAFNKSVKQQALKKMAEAGLTNVTVETAHSLAFKRVIIGNGYSLNHIKTHELWNILRPGLPPLLTDLLTITHAQRFASYFCNSDVEKVTKLNYRDILKTPEELDFVDKSYDEIELLTREYLAGMYKRTIPISHDFYLKLFHLSKPQLGYEYILFDEAQDASPVMIDVVDKQKHAIKVIAGDTHQQIYRWRHAKNAMRSFNYPVLPLTKSFRLPPRLAKLATSLLDTKGNFMEHPEVQITGTTKKKTPSKTHVTIGRTNIGLLSAAINFLGKRRTTKKIFFEGHINSYLFGEEGGSLSDVLNLYNMKRNYIQSPIIQQTEDMDSLEEYAEKTGDVPLQQVIDLVKKHGDELPKMIAKLRKSHVDEAEKHEADMHFSTVHRCKGLEYDEVFLCDDFMSEKALLARLAKKDDDSDPEALEEEVNLLYVAATRTKQRLNFPKSLLPKIEADKNCVHLMIDGEKSTSMDTLFKEAPKPQRSRSERVRTERKRAGVYWTKEDEKYITLAHEKGISLQTMAESIGRSRGAIRKRIEKLGLELWD